MFRKLSALKSRMLLCHSDLGFSLAGVFVSLGVRAEPEMELHCLLTEFPLELWKAFLLLSLKQQPSWNPYVCLLQCPIHIA